MIALKSFFYLILSGFVLYTANTQSFPIQYSISNPQVIPAKIKVGPFFNGQKVIVTAELPKCTGVILKLVGKDKEMILNEKGKKTFIWLNVAQVTVKNAPSIYILTGTAKVDKLCSEVDQKNEVIGYNSLKEKIIFESNLPLRGNEFEEFIKLGEYNGSYSINNKAQILSDSDGKQTLKATLEIPSFISPDDYDVVIYCFKDGYLTDKVAVNLSVEEVGLPLIIKNLALNSPAIYGIMAIVVAMIAGSIIGLIFTKKRSSK
jgi:hypothetical protein